MAVTLTYYYADANTGTTPPPGAPWDGTTTFFNDLLVGDTTTGELETTVLTYGAGCDYHSASAIMTGGAVFECPVTLTELRFNYQCSNNLTSPESTCLLPFGAPPPAGYAVTLAGQYSLDGVSWTSFSGSLVDMGAYATATFASVSVKYVNVRVTASYEVYDENDTMTLTARISDYRLTYTEQAPTGTPVLAAMGACQGAQNSLSWTAVACADTYDIERDNVIISTGVVTGLSYADSPVTIGQAYVYRVRARNSAGVGPWSTSRTYTPCNTVVAPTGDTQTDVTDVCEGRKVTWWMDAPVVGATEYTVRLYGPGLPSTGQIIYVGEFVNVDAPQVYQPLLYTGYSFTVQASNDVGDGPEGDPFSFTPCETGCECTVYTRQECPAPEVVV